MLQISRLTALEEDRDHVTAMPPGTLDRAALQGKCADHCLLIDRMCQEGNLFLPTKYAFKYPAWGCFVQTRFTKGKHD